MNTIKYNPQLDYVDLADKYLATCGREQTRLPKIEEFCDLLGINNDTGNEWVKKNPRSSISAAYKKIKAAQMNELVDDGLFGGKEVNASMAIFLLKANHGMVETERVEHSGNFNFMITRNNNPKELNEGD